MDYGGYSSGAVQLAVDLANTDPDLPSALADFLAAHREWFVGRTRMRLTPAERLDVTELARRVRSVVEAADEAVVIERLNDLLAGVDVHPRVTNHDGTLHVHYSRPGTSAVAQLTTAVAVGMALLVMDAGWTRLGLCGAEDCQDVFVDTSRNTSRRFCSETCASRAGVAAYRTRQRQSTGGSAAPGAGPGHP